MRAIRLILINFTDLLCRRAKHREPFKLLLTDVGLAYGVFVADCSAARTSLMMTLDTCIAEVASSKSSSILPGEDGGVTFKMSNFLVVSAIRGSSQMLVVYAWGVFFRA